ncbi:MAG: hypothetical protein PHV05_13650, partial [Candidatus Riflebacteria bacterium]|nr:hypothetical protein [Candidatus Riflebacteria bacterium]
DTTQDASFGPGGLLSEEQLQSLTKDQLTGMEETQNGLIKQAQDSLKEMNSAISDTDTGEGFWSKLGSALNIFSTSEGEKVRDLRADLKGADTKTDVKDVLTKLEKYTKDKEEDFLSRSIRGYSSMSAAQKDVYKEAYEMKLQDRTLEGSHKLLVEQAEKDGTKPPETPTKIIDIATGKAVFESEDIATTYTDGDGNVVNISGDSSSTRSNADLRTAYDAINLGWMGDFNEEPEEVGIYSAAKSLISQGNAKLNVIEMRDTSQENLDLIKKVKASK